MLSKAFEHCSVLDDYPKFMKMSEIGEELYNPYSFFWKHGVHFARYGKKIFEEFHTGMKKVKTKDYRAFGKNVGLALKDTLGYIDKKKVTNDLVEEDDSFQVDLSEDKIQDPYYDSYRVFVDLNGFVLMNLESVPVSNKILYLY